MNFTTKDVDVRSQGKLKSVSKNCGRVLVLPRLSRQSRKRSADYVADVKHESCVSSLFLPSSLIVGGCGGELSEGSSQPVTFNTTKRGSEEVETLHSNVKGNNVRNLMMVEGFTNCTISSPLNAVPTLNYATPLKKLTGDSIARCSSFSPYAYKTPPLEDQRSEHIKMGYNASCSPQKARTSQRESGYHNLLYKHPLSHTSSSHSTPRQVPVTVLSNVNKSVDEKINFNSRRSSVEKSSSRHRLPRIVGKVPPSEQEKHSKEASETCNTFAQLDVKWGIDIGSRSTSFEKCVQIEGRKTPSPHKRVLSPSIQTVHVVSVEKQLELKGKSLFHWSGASNDQFQSRSNVTGDAINQDVFTLPNVSETNRMLGLENFTRESEVNSTCQSCSSQKLACYKKLYDASSCSSNELHAENGGLKQSQSRQRHSSNSLACNSIGNSIKSGSQNSISVCVNSTDSLHSQSSIVSGIRRFNVEQYMPKKDLISRGLKGKIQAKSMMWQFQNTPHSLDVDPGNRDISITDEDCAQSNVSSGLSEDEDDFFLALPTKSTLSSSVDNSNNKRLKMKGFQNVFQSQTNETSTGYFTQKIASPCASDSRMAAKSQNLDRAKYQKFTLGRDSLGLRIDSDGVERTRSHSVISNDNTFCSKKMSKSGYPMQPDFTQRDLITPLNEICTRKHRSFTPPPVEYSFSRRKGELF